MATTTSEDGITITVSAPGKVILHGEHSVVYGKLAIASSLGLRTRITLTEIDGEVCTFDYKALDFVKSFDVKKIQKYLLDIGLPLEDNVREFNVKTPNIIKHDQLILRIEEFLATSQENTQFRRNQALMSVLYLLTAMLNGITIKPFNLLISTDLTLGAGCGSSASFSVCLAAIFLKYMQMNKESSDNNGKGIFTFKEVGLISDWAFSAEKIMHGTPSGVDNTICAYGSLLAFKKGSKNKILDIPTNINILLINTKIQRNTLALVSNVRSLYDAHTDIVNSIFDAMDKISMNAVNYFNMLTDGCSRSIYDKLGDLATINHSLLRALDVSHPQLDNICNILMQFGLHGKLTGAGGGGYAIAIIPPTFDEKLKDAVKKKLQEEGFGVIATDIGGPGVAID